MTEGRVKTTVNAQISKYSLLGVAVYFDIFCRLAIISTLVYLTISFMISSVMKRLKICAGSNIF